MTVFSLPVNLGSVHLDIVPLVRFHKPNRRMLLLHFGLLKPLNQLQKWDSNLPQVIDEDYQGGRGVLFYNKGTQAAI